LVKGDPIKLRGWVLLIYAAGRPYNRLYYFGLNLVNKNDLNLYFYRFVILGKHQKLI